MNNSLFGLEVEIFLDSHKDGITIDNLINEINPRIKVGRLAGEFGVRQLELITFPCAGLDNALERLSSLVKCLPAEYDQFWQGRNPDCFNSEELDWVRSPRYVALVEAFQRKNPDDWYKVLECARSCAVHVNIGIDPWSKVGLLLLNTVYNVAPYISAMTRREHPENKGHMAIWKDWADDYRRLPYYGEMYSSLEDYDKAFSELPKLMSRVGTEGDVWEVDLQNNQSLLCTTDQGLNWKFCRVKWSPSGCWYMEFRVLPTMPMPDLEKYIRSFVSGIFAIIEWSNENNYSVTDIDKATKVAAKASNLFPEKALTEEQWHDYFHQ